MHHDKSDTNSTAYVIGGAGIGAGLMYFLDPQAGRRRRALVRDQLVHLAHEAEDALDATARDVAHRTEGVVAEARARLRREQPSDEVVAGRVREKLGHYTSHPGAIEVAVRDGQVSLSGPILAAEAPGLRQAVRRVRGVRELEDRLEVHESAEGIPALQGGTIRSGERFELFQRRWSPTMRLLVTIAGGALAIAAAGWVSSSNGRRQQQQGWLRGLSAASGRPIRLGW
jgi:hypothetical protein